ncbi:MAG: septum site-determining protein MinC [Synechocystis sp.]|nr:septum site-determining protein MinC [Synechocystis sp.]
MSDDSPNPDWQLAPQEDFVRLTLTLPTGVTHQHLEQSLTTYLRMMAGRWGDRQRVRLAVQNQLLDSRQLQAIAASLQQQNLELQWIETSRRQTAVAAASTGFSVDQTPPDISLIAKEITLPPPPPLVLRQTLRSGGEIRHTGDVVIIGDVNPGSSVTAEGDILIWGCLRGTAHAGAKGDQQAVIMILRLAACQLRIADMVARVGADAGDRRDPEIAYITTEGIRLTPVRQFQRPVST